MPNTLATAVVTGASRGFGRAIAAALVAAGTTVVGVARDERDSAPYAKNSASASHPRRRCHGGGARAGRDPRTTAPACSCSTPGPRRPWHPCTSRPGRPSAATGTPTRGTPSPGPVRHCARRSRPAASVVSLSSGAALGGSPLSGGYASAKAAIRYIRGYAADEAERAGLDTGSSPCFPADPRRRLARPGSPGTPGAGVDRDSSSKACSRSSPPNRSPRPSGTPLGNPQRSRVPGRCGRTATRRPRVDPPHPGRGRDAIERRVRRPHRAVPAGAARALLPDARLDPRRRGPRTGDLPAGVARVRTVRGPLLGAARGCTRSPPWPA